MQKKVIMNLYKLNLWNQYELNNGMTMKTVNLAITSIWIEIWHDFEMTMNFGMNTCEIHHESVNELDIEIDYHNA